MMMMMMMMMRRRRRRRRRMSLTIFMFMTIMMMMMLLLLMMMTTTTPSPFAVPCGYTPGVVGNVSAGMVLMGIIGSAIFGKVLEATYRYREVRSWTIDG
jgi:Kef-type K+ transport system membrane component KefB